MKTSELPLGLKAELPPPARRAVRSSIPPMALPPEALNNKGNPALELNPTPPPPPPEDSKESKEKKGLGVGLGVSYSSMKPSLQSGQKRSEEGEGVIGTVRLH